MRKKLIALWVLVMVLAALLFHFFRTEMVSQASGLDNSAIAPQARAS